MKNKFRNYLQFLLLLVFAQSCSKMLLRISGHIKKPHLEDSKSIKKYCKKAQDPYDIIWMASTKDYFDKIIYKHPGSPDVLIYDKHFNVLQNARGEECHKMLINFFNDSTEYQYKILVDSSYTFLKQKTLVVDSKSIFEDYDYIVVYSWFKWTPRLTKDLFERLSDIKKTNKFKILFISLNKDWQKGQYIRPPKISNKVKNNGRANAPKE